MKRKSKTFKIIPACLILSVLILFSSFTPLKPTNHASIPAFPVLSNETNPKKKTRGFFIKNSHRIQAEVALMETELIIF